MLDLGLSKIALIGVIALVVIGPERLPKVARTIGTLLGRAQRYVADVKAEVSREMDLEELKKMRATVQESAQSFENSIHTHITQTEAELNAAMHYTADEQDALAQDLAQQVKQRAMAKRKKWRTRQRATPMWFRHTHQQRLRVQSGAARVARYRVVNTFRP